MLNIYITNLGKYNEGEIMGKWIDLPIYEEDLVKVLNSIGVDEEHEEYFITDYEIDVDIEGLDIEEYSNIGQLNELAEKFEGLEEYGIEQLKALLESGRIDLDDILEGDICSLLSNYTFVQLDDSSSLDDENLGYSYIEEVYCGDLSCIENISYYFDKDMIIEDLDEENKECYENMTDIEFVENYIEDLGQETLERYFDYESYGSDLRCDVVYIASNYLAIIAKTKKF
ncbi:antirestriction protein ArdA [Clostridioides sp. ZZV14-6153]|uniref:antirestriction protein ArdA n=1 Tax=Clostridioides sp. ZZV14-6153 TaxID=2811494 RepID=UPI001D125DCA|nr:antirestriction protein ArdA [Clostridioides sp. ZZV14-6153]